jgi:uncharacterized protein YaiI (UPF0178 family)
MRIWVDADACPKMIKEILYRAVCRTKLCMILVANKPLFVPTSPFIQKVIVPSGFDMADQHIIDQVVQGDLVITADIPLASAVVDKGATALNPRGELYSANNVRQHLSMRNFNTELRNAGMITGGPAALNKKQVQAFSNNLDKFLTRHKNI